MRVAFGLKAHSGWTALLVLGKRERELIVVDRRRVELTEHEWAKAPYHAAENLSPDAARGLVKRAIDAAHRIAAREMRAALERERERHNEVAACAILVGNPMPEWNTDEILAVHFRMHKAEGALFRDAMVRAAEACGVNLIAIPEKLLAKEAQKRLGAAYPSAVKQIATLGKFVGPPWAKDQKDAALAALVALGGRSQ